MTPLLCVYNQAWIGNLGPPLPDITYNDTDAFITDDIKMSRGNARGLVKTKGSGNDAYLTIDDEVGTNHRNELGARTTVRNSLGNIYTIEKAVSDSTIVMEKSINDGISFQLQDNSNRPTGADTNAIACAIDSVGIIHNVWWDDGVGLRYVTFSTITDLWGTAVTAHVDAGTSSATPYVAITIDSNDIPQVVFSDSGEDVQYVNRIGGTWSTTETVTSATTVDSLDCTMDSEDIIQVAVKTDTQVKTYTATQNDAQSFTTRVLVATSSIGSVSILIDRMGDTHVFGLGSADFIIHWRHPKASPWTAGIWIQTFVTLSGGPDYESLSATIDQAGDLYVFATDVTNDETTYYKSTTLGRSWGTAQTDDMGTIVDENIRTRWSYLNYHFPNKLDYTLNDTTANDIYFNTVLVDTYETWRSTDSINGVFNECDRGARNLVRTSTGVIYQLSRIPASGDAITVKKSVDEGVTWVSQDVGNQPFASSEAVACAIDSTGIIHIFWWNNVSGGFYITFDTTTDLYVGSAFKNVDDSGVHAFEYVAITVDSNDVPHVAYTLDGATTDSDVEYKNRVGGSWNTAVTIDLAELFNLDITIDDDDIPQIVWAEDQISVKAAIGNVNNATSFTDFTLNTTSLGKLAPSIVVDKKGDTYVSYISAGDLKVRKHLKDDAWSTWETEVNVVTGTFEDTSMMLDIYDNPIVFTNNSSNVGFAYKSTDLGVTWSAIDTSHDISGIVDEHTRCRWSFLNFYFPSQFDYTVSEISTNDIAYNKIVQTGPGYLFTLGRSTSSSLESWTSPTNGFTWEIFDGANEPGGASANFMDNAIDSLDNVHCIFWDGGVGLRYVIIDQATQLYGTVETAQANTEAGSSKVQSIAIDSADKPHVAWNDPDTGTVGTVYYTNKISGWSTKVELDTTTLDNWKVSMTIDQDDIPQVVQTGVPGANSYLGNQNDATSFSAFEFETTGILNNMPSICIDSLGNTHATWIEDGDIKYRKHNVGDAWSTWQTEINVETGSFDFGVSMIIDSLDNIILFSVQPSETYAWMSKNGGTTFGDPVTHDSVGVTDQFIRARWSYLNYTDPNSYDYTNWNQSSDDVVYNTAFKT